MTVLQGGTGCCGTGDGMVCDVWVRTCVFGGGRIFPFTPPQSIDDLPVRQGEGMQMVPVPNLKNAAKIQLTELFHIYYFF